MKNNYPIKYAAIPIKRETGWDGRREIEAYIVSKCYVISETKKYFPNGKTKKEYEISFPFEVEEPFSNKWKRSEPNFNYLTEKCFNSIIVDDIYDDYEKANNDAKSKNEQLLVKKLSLLPLSEFMNKKDKIIEEHTELLNRYEIFETQVRENTTDIKIGEEIKEQSIITKIDDEEKYLKDVSLYEFINIKPNTNISFCAYNVSVDEYEKMKNDINKSGHCNSNKQNLLMVNIIGDKRINLLDYNSVNEKGYYYIKNNFMYYDKELPTYVKNLNSNEHQRKLEIYTIETYEDVIKSCIPNLFSLYNEKVEIGEEKINKVLTLHR